MDARRLALYTSLSSTQGGKAEEVTWEDQQHICAFGRMNTRLHELNGELRQKAVS